MFKKYWSEEESYKFIIHKHEAEKAGLHYDLRIATDIKDTLISFASRKLLAFSNSLNNRILLIRQPDHSSFWLSFEGYWEKGYGKGKFKIIDRGKVIIKSINYNRCILEFFGKKLKGIVVIVKYNNDYFLLIRSKKHLDLEKSK